MVEHANTFNNAIVTLDVALPGVIWGWMITLNMWAKSIATGVILVGGYLIARYGSENLKGIKNIVPVVAFIFLNIFLLFTLLDLHQPQRMINIFLHPHFTSAITVGAWLATVLTGIISYMTYLVVIKKDLSHPYDKLFKAAFILAIPVTLYTAVIMGETSARELWQTPAELIQMALAALLTGAGTLAFFSKNWSKEARKDLSIIIATSAFLAFVMYMGEYFFSWKLAEAEATLAQIHSGGDYFTMFWTGQIIAFIIPLVVALKAAKDGNGALLKLAGTFAIAGLYITKHVWLIIPQLLSLS